MRVGPVLVAALLAAPVTGGENSDVQVMRDGVGLRVHRPAAVADTLVALVESASVNSTESVRPNGRWMQALAAPSRVHVRLEPPRHVRVMDAGNQEWRTQAVSEILVVVPRDAWPDHVLLKSDAGTVSVTKYSPCTLAQLVVEAELGLSDTPRYKLLESGCAKVKTHRPG